MVPASSQEKIDDALDRIEGTILPCIGMMLDTLLDAAEVRAGGISRSAYAAELRTLALQLETLTRDIETMSPLRANADDKDEQRRSAAA